MRVGIFSDTHNDLSSIQAAMRALIDNHAELILHCGDLTSPAAAACLAGLPVIHVTGNGDVAESEINARLRELDPANRSLEVFTAEWEGLRVAALHSHQAGLLRGMIQGGRYDLIFHGHTHRPRDERVSQTRVINPGALGVKMDGQRSFCLLELPSGDLTWFHI